MQFVLRGIKGVLVYIDDIIIATKDWESHLTVLREVLERLRKYSLTAKPSKCVFAAAEIKVLGFIVDHRGTRPDPDNVKAIVEMPRPKDKKEVMTFLGMANYFHRFIPHCSDIEAPLRVATIDYVWGQEQEDAFNKLKEILAALPTLRFFDPKLTTVIHTDASDKGIGGSLVQILDDGTEHPIQFYSRTLRPPETRY